MSARLPTKLLVGALLRRADAAGGQAAVLARGDVDAGGLALVLRSAGSVAVRESWTDMDGRRRLRPVTLPDDEREVDQWVDRRRADDPDLWVVELSIADAERFAAETIGFD